MSRFSNKNGLASSTMVFLFAKHVTTVRITLAPPTSWRHINLIKYARMYMYRYRIPVPQFLHAICFSNDLHILFTLIKHSIATCSYWSWAQTINRFRSINKMYFCSHDKILSLQVNDNEIIQLNAYNIMHSYMYSSVSYCDKLIFTRYGIIRYYGQFQAEL